MSEYDSDCSDDDLRKYVNVMLHNGGHTIQAGYAFDEAPRVEIPNVCTGNAVGNDAQSQAGRLSFDCKSPIQKGIITDWDTMEKVWHHAFHQELGVPFDNAGVLMTESSMNDKASRKKSIQIMFETFGFKRYCVQPGSTLALYASGKTTGLVIDSGHDHTTISPHYEGYSLSHATKRLDVGGANVTAHFAERIAGFKEYSSSQYLAAETAKKEAALCVSDGPLRLYTLDSFIENFGDNLGREMWGFCYEGAYRYTLPDGKIISFDRERFLSTDCLFEAGGIAKAANDSIQLCDEDIRDYMLEHVVLAGGNSMIPGFDDVLCASWPIRTAKQESLLKIIAKPERKYLTWKGMTLLGNESADHFRNSSSYIWKSHYDEAGPSIVHRKFPL